MDYFPFADLILEWICDRWVFLAKLCGLVFIVGGLLFMARVPHPISYFVGMALAVFGISLPIMAMFMSDRNEHQPGS